MNCENCGSSSLIQDYNMGELVCEACGEVYSGGMFENEVEFVNNMATSKTVGTHILHSELAQDGYKIDAIMKQLTSRFKLHETILETAKHIFVFLRKDKIFSLRGRLREAVIGACVFIAARMNKEHASLLLADIGKQFGFKQKQQKNLNKTYFDIITLWKSHHTDKIESGLPSSFVDRYASKLELGKDRFRIISKTHSILDEMNNIEGVRGSRPSGICGAALFIAIQDFNLPITFSKISSVVKMSERIMLQHIEKFQSTQAQKQEIAELLTKKRKSHTNSGKSRKKRITKAELEHKVLNDVRQQLIKEGKIHKDTFKPILTLSEVKTLHEKAMIIKKKLETEKDFVERQLYQVELKQLLKAMQSRTAPPHQPHRHLNDDTLFSEDDDDEEDYVLNESEVKKREEEWNTKFGSEDFSKQTKKKVNKNKKKKKKTNLVTNFTNVAPIALNDTLVIPSLPNHTLTRRHTHEEDDKKDEEDEEEDEEEEEEEEEEEDEEDEINEEDVVQEVFNPHKDSRNADDEEGAAANDYDADYGEGDVGDEYGEEYY